MAISVLPTLPICYSYQTKPQREEQQRKTIHRGEKKNGFTSWPVQLERGAYQFTFVVGSLQGIAAKTYEVLFRLSDLDHWKQFALERDRLRL
ncbi:hypothetical protein ACLB2K_011463 [Fragaria x ananassa]